MKTIGLVCGEHMRKLHEINRYRNERVDEVHYVFRFDNGYVVDVAKNFFAYEGAWHGTSMGADDDLWEIAIYKFVGDDQQSVIGYLTDEEVCVELRKIKML